MGGALKGDSPSRGGGAAPTPTPRPRPPLPPSARPRLPTQNASRCCRPVADNLIGTFVMSKCKNTLFLLPSFSPPPAHSPSCPWNSQKSGPRARPQLRPSCLPPAYPPFPPPPRPGMESRTLGSRPGSYIYKRWPWQSHLSSPISCHHLGAPGTRLPHREQVNDSGLTEASSCRGGRGR